MTEQVTLTLPADVIESARVVAVRSGRPVDDVIAEALQRAFVPLSRLIPATPPSHWSDQEVLDAADGQMPEREDERLSELLDRQQGGRLRETERGELEALMEIYKRGLLLKSEGIREAVKRGLREPPHP